LLYFINAVGIEIVVGIFSSLLFSCCVFLKNREKRSQWKEQAEPSFNPSAMRLEWGEATVSDRLCQLELEETASCLQGMLYVTSLSDEQSVVAMNWLRSC